MNIAEVGNSDFVWAVFRCNVNTVLSLRVLLLLLLIVATQTSRVTPRHTE